MNRCNELEKWNFYFTLPPSISRTGQGLAEKEDQLISETTSGNGRSSVYTVGRFSRWRHDIRQSSRCSSGHLSLSLKRRYSYSITLLSKHGRWKATYRGYKRRPGKIRNGEASTLQQLYHCGGRQQPVQPYIAWFNYPTAAVDILSPLLPNVRMRGSVKREGRNNHRSVAAPFN